MHAWKVSLWLTVLMTAVCGPSRCGPARAAEDDPFEPVRKRIAKALVDHQIPSIAVAVAKEGEIIWEQGFGWADREDRRESTEHTMYSLASISKPITATGLMLLVEKKKIDLDKPVNDYLGDAKLVARVGDIASATVRRVANHTAGLPLHYQFFYAGESYAVPARDETIRRFGNLVTAPGERYHYSNLGYGVLDYLVERASGKSYADYMREEVFLPLGLTHTSVGVGDGLEEHQAMRYTAEGKPIPFYEFDHPGASAVYSSAHDLVRFAMFHMKEHLADQKQILSDATIDAMQVDTTQPLEGSYGIGWGSFDDARGYHIVSHSGGMPGVSTLCTLVPEERVAVVVLANSRAGVVGYISEMIQKIVLPETKDRPKSKSDDESGHEGEISSQLTGKWRGHVATYRGDKKLTLDVKESGDVHLQLGDELPTLLAGATLRDGFLRGRFAGDLGMEDEARGRRCELMLEAKLRGDSLGGGLIMTTHFDGWGNSATTYWVELERERVEKKDPEAAASGG